MAMISSLNIAQYRGIRDLQIDSLGRVNLLVGDNNSGKTSVLEAIQLVRPLGSIANLYNIARQREKIYGKAGNSLYENFICMFPYDAELLKIMISGICNDKPLVCDIRGEQHKVLFDKNELDMGAKTFGEIINDRISEKISEARETDVFEGVMYSRYGNDISEVNLHLNRYSKISGTKLNKNVDFPVEYISPFEHLMGSNTDTVLRDDKYKKLCINILQFFDPDIEDIVLLTNPLNNQPVEYLKHRKLGNMPLSTYGDGLKKVLVLSNAIAKAAGGILLIDEIETSIHQKYHSTIFQFIITTCQRFDVQAFITTHSIETIDGFLAAQDYENSTISGDVDPIKVITLKKGKDKTFSSVMSGKDVYVGREAFGFEVRL